MDKPPLLRPVKSLRFAFTLNLVLPGAGQLYLGQTALGLAYMIGFLACFITLLTSFFRVYRQYLNGDFLVGDNLEKLAAAIPTKTLVILVILATAICIASMISLGFTRRAPDGTPVG